jgi:hypothetical protein
VQTGSAVFTAEDMLLFGFTLSGETGRRQSRTKRKKIKQRKTKPAIAGK